MQIFLNHLFRILRTWAQAYYIKSKFFQFVLYSRVRPIFFILIQHVATSYRLQMSDLLLSDSYLGNFQKRQKKTQQIFLIMWGGLNKKTDPPYLDKLQHRRPLHPVCRKCFILFFFFEGTLLKELVRWKYNY